MYMRVCVWEGKGGVWLGEIIIESFFLFEMFIITEFVCAKGSLSQVL